MNQRNFHNPNLVFNRPFVNWLINASEAKKVFEQSFEDVMNSTISALPPQIAAMGLQLMSGGITGRFPISNVAISNVPGAPIPLYIEGAKVVANYPMGPVPNGVGLNITMMSYVDRLDFCVQSCRDKIPDPWLLVEQIEAASAELLTLIPEAEGKAGGRKKTTSRKTPARKTRAQVKQGSAAKKAPAKKKAPVKKNAAVKKKAAAKKKAAVKSSPARKRTAAKKKAG